MADRYQEAVDLVLDVEFTNQMTMAIHRGLKVGFNEAAAYVERMEREGVVSVPDNMGVRAILRRPR